MPLDVLVCGATGRQGGATARALLDIGQRVRALTRHPESEAARLLARQGATVLRGDWDDPGSLRRAADGADAMFGMTDPSEGFDVEQRQARNQIEAAGDAAVSHLVWSSVASADQRTGVDLFEAKAEIEGLVRKSGVPWTIVAPVYFCENLLSPRSLQALGEGALALVLGGDRPLQVVATADIGRFVAYVIDDREAFLARRLEIASDELTPRRMATVLSRVLGRQVRHRDVPLSEVRQRSEAAARMYEWTDRVGYRADVDGLRERYPEVGWLRFEEWARAQDWQGLLETV